MAINRNIPNTIWNEPQLDNYTDDDMYMYLYLHTNKLTNLCGCYAFSVREAAHDMRKDAAEVEALLERAAEIHKAIMWDKTTNEILVCDWKQRNWSKSDTTAKCIAKELKEIKSETLQAAMDEITLDYLKKEVIPNYPMVENANPLHTAKHEIEDRIKNRCPIDAP